LIDENKIRFDGFNDAFKLQVTQLEEAADADADPDADPDDESVDVCNP
jgi:hypothetical protein